VLWMVTFLALPFRKCESQAQKSDPKTLPGCTVAAGEPAVRAVEEIDTIPAR